MNINIIKSSNLKLTKARETIIEILSNTKLPITAEEIYNLTNKTINLATIYRNLSLLTHKQILNRTIYEDGKMYYELSSSIHRHCLVCNICHNIIPIDGCPIENISKDVTKKTGFLITSHVLELRGICPDCQK